MDHGDLTSVTFQSKYYTFHRRKYIWKWRLRIGGHFVSAITVTLKRYGGVFGITDPLWGETTGHRWRRSQRVIDWELSFLRCSPKHAVEQTVDFWWFGTQWRSGAVTVMINMMPEGKRICKFEIDENVELFVWTFKQAPLLSNRISVIHGSRINYETICCPQFCTYSYQILCHVGGTSPPTWHKIW